MVFLPAPVWRQVRDYLFADKSTRRARLDLTRRRLMCLQCSAEFGYKELCWARCSAEGEQRPRCPFCGAPGPLLLAIQPTARRGQYISLESERRYHVI